MVHLFTYGVYKYNFNGMECTIKESKIMTSSVIWSRLYIFMGWIWFIKIECIYVCSYTHTYVFFFCESCSSAKLRKIFQATLTYQGEKRNRNLILPFKTFCKNFICFKKILSEHSSEKRGLRSTFLSRKMLQNLPYL